MTLQEFREQFDMEQNIRATLMNFALVNSTLSHPNATGGDMQDELYLEEVKNCLITFYDQLFNAYALQTFNFDDTRYIPNKEVGIQFKQVMYQFEMWFNDSIYKVLNKLATIAQRIKKEYNNKEQINNAIISTIRHGFTGFSNENTQDGTYNITRTETNDNTYAKWNKMMRWEYREWYTELEMELVNEWLVVIYEY